MFNLEGFIDLPLVWGALIVTAVFLYVLLDGFDLGVGILFPFAPENKCRDRAINSIAPFWDGNETWLVLGGGGLFAAFPLAYGVIMPALYVPIICMLLALIFRGIAFEFRYKAEPKNRPIWDYSFHFGSLLAAFFQGAVLGGLLQGIKVQNNAFAGGPFDWLTGFSVMVGFALVVGYALLGATWLIMKTEDITQAWARKCALYLSAYMVLFLIVVSIWMPFIDELVYNRWFSWPNILYLSPIPLVTTITILALIRHVKGTSEVWPFVLTQLIFVLGYIGLVVGFWPSIVPHTISFRDAAAIPEAQSLLLVGTLVILPVILGYTAYCYYVFRGKSSDEQMY